MTKTTLNTSEQVLIDNVLSSLNGIYTQNHKIAQKIDDLENKVIKKATMAGILAGFFAGITGSGLFGIIMEIIKGKSF